MLFRLMIIKNLFEKASYDTKIKEIEDKIDDFNKLSGTIFDERLNKIKLARATDLNTVKQLAIRNEEKIGKIQRFGWISFIGKKFLGNDGFQNMIVHQPKFSMLGLKKYKGNKYAISWKSKG